MDFGGRVDVEEALAVEEDGETVLLGALHDIIMIGAYWSHLFIGDGHTHL